MKDCEICIKIEVAVAVPQKNSSCVMLIFQKSGIGALAWLRQEKLRALLIALKLIALLIATLHFWDDIGSLFNMGKAALKKGRKKIKACHTRS